MRKRKRVYAYDGDKHPSMAKQEFKGECDVNKIVQLYRQGSPMPVQVRSGQFADVSDMPDYKTAVETVMEAKAIFRQLPMDVKRACGNTVAGFLDFVNDPANAQELVELGLMPAETAPPEAAPAGVEAPRSVEPAAVDDDGLKPVEKEEKS